VTRLGGTWKFLIFRVGGDQCEREAAGSTRRLLQADA